MSDEKKKPTVYLVHDSAAPAIDATKAADGGDGTGAPAPVWTSDDALANELAETLGEDWRCAHPGAEWYRWTGQRWERDATLAVLHRARLVCRGVASEIQKHSLARAVSSKTTIYAAARLAGEDRRIALGQEAFDRNDWLLNTPSCTVDLRTGQPQLHQRSDYCARMARVAPEGDCPVFYSFLLEACGKDQALIAFLQRWFGYCLTGSILEQAFVFVEGPGGTGKSVLVHILQWILGDYATSAAMDLFMERTGERHSAGFAVLKSARLVTSSETADGGRWDEGMVKRITGGEPITANRMRQDPITFVPNFKLFLSGNFRPVLKAADDAMQRRLLIVPFRVKPARVDKQLFEKLQAEAGGILKWAIEGAVKWQHEGLNAPPAVRDVTDEYFAEQNRMGLWIEERCSVDPAAWGSTKALYKDFAAWVATIGERAEGERRFSQRLERLGFKKKRDPQVPKNMGGRGFKGIAPLAAPRELDFADRTHPPARGGGDQRTSSSLPIGREDDDADRWEEEGERE